MSLLDVAGCLLFGLSAFFFAIAVWGGADDKNSTGG
jgi:hypothetical protein